MTDLPAWAGILLISAATFGPVAGWYATRRRRQAVTWWILGSLTGPVALILLRIAPPGRCPACETRVEGWPASCELCGWPFDIPLRRPSVSAEPSRPAVAAAPVHEVHTQPLVVQMADEVTPIPMPVSSVVQPTSNDAGIRRWVTSGASRPLAAATRAPTAVSRPTTAVSRPPAELRPPSREAQMLATAVYFGGTAGLVVGSRYAIVRHEDRLRLLGPLDWDPSAIALERPLSEIVVTAIEDRLIIRSEGWRGIALAFGSLAGASGEDLELALTMPHMIAPGVRPA